MAKKRKKCILIQKNKAREVYQCGRKKVEISKLGIGREWMTWVGNKQIGRTGTKKQQINKLKRL